MTIFAMCLSSLNVLAQAIVNIEDLRREGEVGFFTSISANLYAARGNRDRDYYSAQLRFDNNSENVFFLNGLFKLISILLKDQKIYICVFNAFYMVLWFVLKKIHQLLF